MKVIKLNIPVAGCWKRDCELTDIQVKPSLLLAFNVETDDSVWRIVFKDYIAIKITSEEFTADKCLRALPVEGAFFEIADSPWIEELMYAKKEILEKCKHFVFCFYDEAIEVIAEGFALDKIS